MSGSPTSNTQKTIAAYTAPGAEYPSFINIVERGGAIFVTVRGKKIHDGAIGYALPGALAEVSLSASEWADLVTACNLNRPGV
jgi:hypothetical protein